MNVIKKYKTVINFGNWKREKQRGQKYVISNVIQIVVNRRIMNSFLFHMIVENADIV